MREALQRGVPHHQGVEVSAKELRDSGAPVASGGPEQEVSAKELRGALQCPDATACTEVSAKELREAL